MTDKSQRQGMLFALAGFVSLSLGDGVVKSMAGQWPPTAVAALRYTIGAIALGALLYHRQGRAGFRMPHPRIQMLRGGAVALATVGFFSAVYVLPLATATSITFTSPMITALLAALVLGEPARRETWVASAMAFVGVLIVLRPNFAETGWAVLLPLAAATGMSLLMVGNRLVAGTASALSMQFFVAAFAAPILVLAAIAFDQSGLDRFAVSLPAWHVVARCGLVALFASIAHWLIYLGTTRAGASAIAPTVYGQLLIATLLGWLFFGSHPDLWTMVGAATIVAAGLYLWRAGARRAEMHGD